MTENEIGVTVLTAGGWLKGMQVLPESWGPKVMEQAKGLRCEAEDLVVLRECWGQGWGADPVPFVILRRSAVLGIVVDSIT